MQLLLLRHLMHAYALCALQLLCFLHLSDGTACMH
jgi:hypothetical protein